MARLAVGRAILPPLLHLGGHYGWNIEQWIKEGKQAVKWTKRSCRRFKDNAARLQLFALAYNLANFLRQLVLPKPIKGWTLTTLREKLIKIGAKVVSHSKYVIFQLAEVAVPRQLFAAILERITRLRLVCASG
jgi:Transposase DDE domain group 1